MLENIPYKRGMWIAKPWPKECSGWRKEHHLQGVMLFLSFPVALCPTNARRPVQMVQLSLPQANTAVFCIFSLTPVLFKALQTDCSRIAFQSYSSAPSKPQVLSYNRVHNVHFVFILFHKLTIHFTQKNTEINWWRAFPCEFRVYTPSKRMGLRLVTS